MLGNPSILRALNPIRGIMFLFSPINHSGIMVLGFVFLSTTGAEALYSDMGHVGKANIYASWPFVKAASSSTIWVKALGCSPITPTPRCSQWISSTRSI